MKSLLVAATALTLTGSALAYQTTVDDQTADSMAVSSDPAAAASTDSMTQQSMAVDQNAASTPSAQPDLQTFAGMGGPYEDVYSGGSVNLTPRAADRNYPPCDPGPGDDHCIQLYERGVRSQLASWNRATGGLADGSASTAMGGPYEPVNGAGTTGSTAPTTGTSSAAGTTATTTRGSQAGSMSGSTTSPHSGHAGSHPSDPPTGPVNGSTADPAGTTQDDTTQPQ